jgi:PAS domain S-box-containing protein
MSSMPRGSGASRLTRHLESSERGGNSHVVQFYDDDGFLLDSVSRVIGISLEAGGGGVVIATRPHLDGIEERLGARGLDMAAARRQGQYVPLDAAQTLSKVMDDGRPDEKRFVDVVGAAIAAAAQRRPRVRAFVEMVALLWAEGNYKAAIRLEECVSDLIRSRSFSVLCAYPMRDFGRAVHSEPFLEICAGHSQVIPTETYAALSTPDERLRMITDLQQKARVLESAQGELGELQIRARRFAAIVEGSDDAIVGKTLKGIITSWNRGAERIFGYTEEEAVGQPITLIVPPERQHEEIEVLTRVGRGEAIQHFETVRVRKDGQHIDISLSVSPVRNDRDQIIGAAKIARDITENKRIESERAQLLARERHARAEAEAASRGKDEFLATLSHELRTPLNAILGWVRMLRAGSLTDGASDRAIEVIERNTHNLGQLVSDLLDVSRIITGKMTLNVGTVDLVHVIGIVIDSLRPAAEAKRITVQPVLAYTVRPLRADQDRLQQVVWNLLSNAVKFTPEGGRVEVRLTAPDEGARITVTDTGKGISPDFLPYLFERFRQADSTTTRAHAGLGLGLAIVRHIIELHGGTVRAESDGVDKGATFVVDLPYGAPREIAATRPRSPAQAQPSAMPSNALQGVRVLVVDDSPDTCELLMTVFRQQGAEASTATSAREALAWLERASPDVVVSDIAMPGIDGYELIRRIRSRPGDAGGRVPAVALTAYARSEDRDRALAAGFDGYLSKPVEPAELIRIVGAVAEKRLRV